MENPLLLSEVARLHQRDVAKEVASREITTQVKIPQIVRPGQIKRFVMLSFSSNRNGDTKTTAEALSR